jgi:transposase
MGSRAHGYCNELWTVPRVRRLLAEKLGKPCSGSETWRLLQRIGFSSQKPVRRARERKPEAIEQWKKETWPALCKQAKEEKLQIVFVDESGLSLKPVRQASFAPRGEPLVLEFNFNWDKLSAIGAVSTSEIFFCLHEESIKSEQVIAFVNHLHAQIGQPLLIIWDGLRAHWSKAVKAHIATFDGKILVQQLPAYAPELNPVEYLWSHLKGNDLANFAAKNLQELSQVSRAAVAKILPNRKKYLHAFWIQTELDLSGL